MFGWIDFVCGIDVGVDGCGRVMTFDFKHDLTMHFGSSERWRGGLEFNLNGVSM